MMKYKVKQIPALFLIAATLCIFMLLHVNGLYVSDADESGEWKAVTYCEIVVDPKKTWSGYVCYYGDSEPPKTVVINCTVEGETAVFAAEKEADVSCQEKCTKSRQKVYQCGIAVLPQSMPEEFVTYSTSWWGSM